MDQRTRDETKNNLSSPNEVSNPNGDNSGNDSGTKEFIYKSDDKNEEKNNNN